MRCCIVMLPTRWTAAASAQPAGGAVEMAVSAMGLLGVPCKFGGDDPSAGRNCSGLVRFVAHSALGMELSRQAEAISRARAEVDPQKLRPGNVVFFFSALGRLFRTSVSSWVTTASSMPWRAREGSAWNMCRSRQWRARFGGWRLNLRVGEESAGLPFSNRADLRWGGSSAPRD